MNAKPWLVALSVFVIYGPARASGEALEVRLAGKSPATVEVSGLSAAHLAAIARLGSPQEAWPALLAVHVVPAAGKALGPAVPGSYRVEGGVFRFEPRFPLAPGVRYLAVFDPAKVPECSTWNIKAVKREFLLPKPETEPARVTHVYPSTDRLPENTLKFYVHFSAPMARGGVYRHLRLLDERGKAVDLPFLELDEELWDGSGKRLTVFCDPGRIKRGLKPREEDGPVLEEGKRYTLVVDADLKDANGNRLKQPFRKPFRVLPPDDTQPDPKTWKVQPPAAGSRGSLTVTFPKPLDHALLERLLWVADGHGRKLLGTLAIEAQETVWRFTPDAAWEAGRYELVADTRLEDLAGNSIARPFEVDVFRPVQHAVREETVKVPFEVRTGR